MWWQCQKKIPELKLNWNDCKMNFLGLLKVKNESILGYRDKNQLIS